MFTLRKKITAISIATIIGATFVSSVMAEEPPVMDYEVLINDAYGDPFHSVLVDPYGNTITVGSTPARDEYIQPNTIMVAKHDAGGNLLWKDYTPRSESLNSGLDKAIHTKLDSKGNLYILFSGGTNCGELVKFNHAGERSVISEATGCLYVDLRIDENDNLYVFNDRATGGGYVTRYSQDAVEWSSAFGKSRSYRGIQDIATDSAGNVYLYGHTWTRSTTTPLIVKLDSAGNYLWEASFSSETTVQLKAKNVLIDANDQIFLTAHAIGEVHLAKYNSDGTQLFQHKHEDPDLASFAPKSFINAQGDVTTFTTTRPEVWSRANQFDLLFLKYTNSGEGVYHKQIDFGYSERTAYTYIANDKSDNFYMAMGGASITKLDPMGEVVWQTPAIANYAYRDLELSNDGKLVAGGLYSDYGFGSSNNHNVDAIVHAYDVSTPIVCVNEQLQ